VKEKDLDYYHQLGASPHPSSKCSTKLGPVGEVLRAHATHNPIEYVVIIVKETTASTITLVPPPA